MPLCLTDEGNVPARFFPVGGLLPTRKSQLAASNQIRIFSVSIIHHPTIHVCVGAEGITIYHLYTSFACDEAWCFLPPTWVFLNLWCFPSLRSLTWTTHSKKTWLSMGKRGGGSGYPHLLPNLLLWILWMLLELILVKAGYPSSLAKQQKPWRNGSGSTDLFRFYDHVSCISWGILVPLNNFKKIMGQTSWDVSFGFNCFSHLGQDSQHLLCKKKKISFPSC